MKQTIKQAVSTQFTSIKDSAYKQAKAYDSINEVARFVLTNCPSFVDEVPEEIKGQLYDGYRLRFAENNPAKQYAIVNDHYVLIDGSNPDLEKSPKVSVSVDYVFSFTQQQFGKLKDSEPYLYQIVKPERDKINTYCSNRLGDLKRTARKLLNDGKTSTRNATLDFEQRLANIFDDLKVKCKNAKARGDETANEKKLSLAIAAFNVAWNK